MAHQDRMDTADPGKPLVQRILKYGCPPGKSLLYYRIPLPKKLRQMPGPASLSVESPSGPGIIAVSIGISEADDCFHFFSYPFTAPMASPWTNCFCISHTKRRTGSRVMSEVAAIGPTMKSHSFHRAPRLADSLPQSRDTTEKEALLP